MTLEIDRFIFRLMDNLIHFPGAIGKKGSHWLFISHLSRGLKYISHLNDFVNLKLLICSRWVQILSEKENRFKKGQYFLRHICCTLLGQHDHARNRLRMPHKCDFCFFSSGCSKKLIRHTLNSHSSDASFKLSCHEPKCTYTSKEWESFRKHLQRVHGVRNMALYFSIVGDVMFGNPQDVLPKNLDDQSEHMSVDSDEPDPQGIVDEVNDESTSEDEGEAADADLFPVYTPGVKGASAACNVDRVFAKHLLELETCHRVPKVAVTKIADGTQNLSTQLLTTIRNKLVDKFDSIEYKEAVLDTFSEHWPHSWSNFDTNHKRQTFYKDHFKYVAPREVFLGAAYEPLTYGADDRQLKNHRAAYVPLRQLLTMLLHLPEVWHYFQNSHASHDDVYRDICDGSYVQNHKFTRAGVPWLQFVLSHDDVEMQNPLRSSQFHKMAMFYFSLANFPPQHRSAMHNIFVAAIARSKDVKHFGLTNILQDFLETINCLKTTGIWFNIRGENHLIRGDLVMVVADTPAAALLGGFKESSSFASAPCRMCHVSSDDAKTQFIPSQLRNRDMASYFQQCEVVQDNELSRKFQRYWSRTYGVNSKSVLCAVRDFPVTNNLVQDTMHCLLEGCFNHVLALFFQHASGVLSLHRVNALLQSFPYCYLDKGNKPVIITQKHIEKDVHVKQKASCMLTLAYILPLVLGNVFPETDKHYRHLLGMIKIICCAFSPLADDATAGELETLIHCYCRDFLVLYPNVPPRPKMHFILHLPQQIRDFGPLRGQNTFKYEGKHGRFKDIHWKNFINLALSMLEKHQLQLCHKMSQTDGQFSSNFVYSGDDVKFGKTLSAAEVEILSEIGDLDESQTYRQVLFADINGLKYAPNVALVSHETALEGPTFGLISRMIADKNTFHFVLQKTQTGAFLERYNAFEIFPRQEKCIVKLEDLERLWPLPVYGQGGMLLVANRFSKILPCY